MKKRDNAYSKFDKSSDFFVANFNHIAYFAYNYSVKMINVLLMIKVMENGVIKQIYIFLVPIFLSFLIFIPQVADEASYTGGNDPSRANGLIFLEASFTYYHNFCDAFEIVI